MSMASRRIVKAADSSGRGGAAVVSSSRSCGPGSTSEPRQSAVETIGGLGSAGFASPGVSGSAPRRRYAKTPRNGGNFVRGSTLQPNILRARRLNGGGGSLERTRLCCRFPDLQGKYREILRNWTLLADSAPRFRSLSAVVATDSL
jgi:hypothetical protein